MFNMGKKDEKILVVSEGVMGLTTYINPYIHKLNDAYKEQIRSTLKKILADLEENRA